MAVTDSVGVDRMGCAIVGGFMKKTNRRTNRRLNHRDRRIADDSGCHLDMDRHRRHGMKQKLIYWLLNYPCPAYDSIKASVWLRCKPKRWDRLRVGLARWLMEVE